MDPKDWIELKQKGLIRVFAVDKATMLFMRYEYKADGECIVAEQGNLTKELVDTQITNFEVLQKTRVEGLNAIKADIDAECAKIALPEKIGLEG